MAAGAIASGDTSRLGQLHAQSWKHLLPQGDVCMNKGSAGTSLWSVKARRYQPRTLVPFPPGRLILFREYLTFTVSPLLKFFAAMFPVYSWESPLNAIESIEIADDPLGPPLRFGKVLKINMSDSREEYFALSDDAASRRELEALVHELRS
jgi:hypothetical protein